MNRKKEIIRKLCMDDRTLDKNVKLEGTDYDRRRVLTNNDVKRIRKMYDEGHSYAELSKLYGVASDTIKYHVNENFKNYINTIRSTYTNNSCVNKKRAATERARYKRDLVSKGVL